MTAEEVATEITKAWLNQLNSVRNPSASQELKEVYGAAIEAYLEGLNKVRVWPNR